MRRIVGWESLQLCQSLVNGTGWTNVNLLYLPDNIEIVSLKGLTLWCPEINQSKQLLA